eukprot:4296621-Pleurochrysis_carterae.AAC.1
MWTHSGRSGPSQSPAEGHRVTTHTLTSQRPKKWVPKAHLRLTSPQGEATTLPYLTLCRDTSDSVKKV